jgi:serine/threonine protein kinase
MATLTRTGTILGTPGYMSPEQFEGGAVDERTDIYSLGVVLFELLTGRLPFTGQTPLAVALRHKTEPPPPPRSLRREVPAWVERACLRCLEKDPARRFASAAELAKTLRRPRAAGRPSRRILESGDTVIEDETESTDFALVLASSREKTGWSVGMALRYGDRYFRLEQSAAPTGDGAWTYRFSFWPEEQILRKIVDYEQDWRDRAAAAENRLSARVQKWISRRRE